MGRKSKKRRFYPEFYSDDEYRELISPREEVTQKDVPSQEDAPQSDANVTEAKGSEYGKKAGYSEKELTDIYSRLRGTESGNKHFLETLENFKSGFIEENKKFSSFSPENPLKGIELPEPDASEFPRGEQYQSESEPENGGYIQYEDNLPDISGDAVTPSTHEDASINKIINEEEYGAIITEDTMVLDNSNNANEQDEIAVFDDGYIDPDAVSESDDYEDPETVETFSGHYIATGEIIESETYEETAGSIDSVDSLETMERIDYPRMDAEPPAINFAAPVEKEEDIINRMKPESNMSEYGVENSLYPDIKPYDREAAVKYAHRWALDRNAEYYDYDEIGGDCTNYASQVLLAGGCKMDLTPNSGWYYKSGNLKSPSWTGVEYLYNFLIGEKLTGPVGREVEISEVEPGDLVNLSFNGKAYQHCPVIVQVKKTAGAAVSLKDIIICAHSYDCENRPLDTYTWKKMRFIKIVGTK